MKPSKKLLTQWRKKLKASGFDDAEAAGGLKRYHSFDFVKNYSSKAFEEHQEYYALAGQHLYSHKFDSIKDKTVWRWHSEGMSSIEISKRSGIPDRTVRWIIESVRKTLVNR